MIPFKPYGRDQHGSSAVEFALILPVAMILVLGLLHMSAVLYSAVNLHYATEGTARCLAVSANVLASDATATTACPSAASVQTYGQARYYGPGISPTFSVSASAACANTSQVTATGTYNMFMGFVSFPITLSAAACYPHA